MDPAFSGTIAGLTLESSYTGTITLQRSLLIRGLYSQAGGTFDARDQQLTIQGVFTLSGGAFRLAILNPLSVTGEFTVSGGTFDIYVDPVLFGLPATAKEVVSLRTEYAVVFETSPGHYAAMSLGTPLFTRDEQGSLVPIEPFGRNQGGLFSFNRLAGGVRVVFNLNQPSYTLTQGAYSYTFSFHLPAIGVVQDANTISYRLSDNTVLKWHVIGNLVVKAITVETPDPLPDLSFSFTSSDNLTQQLANNIISFLAFTGQTIFATRAPFLMDLQGRVLPNPVTLLQDGTTYRYQYSTDGLPYPYIIDPAAGPNSPTTVVNDVGIGSIAWTSPGNATVSDDTWASVILGALGLSNYLKATGFGFSIPGSAAINGIVVEWKWKQGGALEAEELAVRIVKGGTIGATDRSLGAGFASDTYVSYGSSTDLWGETWTAADINAANFGGAFAVQDITFGGSSSQASVDHVRITVHFTNNVSVSGTVYSDEGVSPISGVTVAVSINGAAAAATIATNGVGAYTLSALNIGAGDVLTLYIDNAVQDAVTVTVGTGANLSSIDLYQDRLIVRQDNAGSLTNTNLDTADNNADPDISALYSVTAGALTVASGKELFIASGHTFAPGGAVTTPNFDLRGTYTHAAETVTVNTAYEQSSGTFSAGSGAIDINGTFTLSGGTFNQGTSLLNVSGSLAISSGATFTKATGGQALTLDGTGNLSDANATKQDLGNVVIGGTTTTRTLTSAVKMTGLTINSGNTFVLGGNTLEFAAAAAVNNSGTFRLRGTETLTNVTNLDLDSGTVEYVGDGAGGTATFTLKDFGATDYFNLTLAGDASETFQLGGALDANGTLTITSGTLDVTGNNYAINVAGNWSNSGTFTARSGSVTLDGASQQILGSTTFYELIKTVTVADTLTFQAGTTQTIVGSNTLTLQGASGALLSLRSSVPGTQWRIDPRGSRTVSFLDVRDSNNINALAISCTNGCVDSGNNIGWIFSVASPAPSPSPAPSNNDINDALVVIDVFNPRLPVEQPAGHAGVAVQPQAAASQAQQAASQAATSLWDTFGTAEAAEGVTTEVTVFEGEVYMVCYSEKDGERKQVPCGSVKAGQRTAVRFNRAPEAPKRLAVLKQLRVRHEAMGMRRQQGPLSTTWRVLGFVLWQVLDVVTND